MKKTTILAVTVVLAIAISAVWLGRDRSRSSQIDSPVAPAAVVATGPEIVSPEANGPVQVAPQSETAQPGPVKVFSPVEVFDDEYRNASLAAAEILAKMTNPPVLRSQILLTNQGQVSEFIRQVTSNGLRQSFDVSPFADDTCTVSSVDRMEPTPEGAVPNGFMVYMHCDSSHKESTAWVNPSERSVSFFMTYGLMSYTVQRIGNSKYSLAFQSHYDVPRPSADGPANRTQ